MPVDPETTDIIKHDGDGNFTFPSGMVLIVSRNVWRPALYVEYQFSKISVVRAEAYG